MTVSTYPGGFDIIFMDIQMRFMDGMTATEKIRKADPDVLLIFLTNRTDYAIRGYMVDALDYIVKPVSYFSFAQRLDRAVSRIAPQSESSMLIRTKEGVMKVRPSEILYVECSGHYLVYHLAERTLTERGRIADIEERFEKQSFFRCNKGCLVNLKHVHGIVKDSCQVGKEQIAVSAARRQAFLFAMTKYIGEGTP